LRMPQAPGLPAKRHDASEPPDRAVNVSTVEKRGPFGPGIGLIINFARDLWWVASDITNTCSMTPNDRTLLLGLPARKGRNRAFVRADPDL
jgi:hypothetical protein